MKSYFNFTKQERRGIFFLLVLIAVFQLAYFGLDRFSTANGADVFSLDIKNQLLTDSLGIEKRKSKLQFKPFNPNYISDYKGYLLGLSPLELDRLHNFRAQNGFVHSAKEFQRITGISDSLLNDISPFFKFPEWTRTTKPTTKKTEVSNNQKPRILDLNTASAQDLKEINGIGEKLSARIIKFRERLGGFLVNEQLYDVYGLEPQIVERALKRFQVLHPPKVKKININTANPDEIASLVYLKYKVAKNIVIYREEHGAYTSKEDLFNVSGFPINKIDRIALYLSY